MPWYCGECIGVPTLVLAPISQAVSLAPDDMTSHPIHCLLSIVHVMYHSSVRFTAQCWYCLLYYNTLARDEIQHFSVGSAIHNSYLVFTWNPLSLCRTQNLRTVFTSIKKIDLTFLPLVMCLSELPSVLQNISEVSHNYSNTELREVLLSFCNVSNSAVQRSNIDDMTCQWYVISELGKITKGSWKH